MLTVWLRAVPHIEGCEAATWPAPHNGMNEKAVGASGVSKLGAIGMRMSSTLNLFFQQQSFGSTIPSLPKRVRMHTPPEEPPIEVPSPPEPTPEPEVPDIKEPEPRMPPVKDPPANPPQAG